MKIINWIEKKIPELRTDHEFNEYFNGKDLEKGLDVYFLYNPEKGIDLVIDIGLSVTTIHLFSGKTNDGKLYAGFIPYNLLFNMSQNEIRLTFGTPNRSGGGVDIIDPIPFGINIIFKVIVYTYNIPPTKKALI
ncbi:hypothetical protein [Paraflavitalea speifideaquila]|uniref:hypothetical protein n=1 Tax=Paraflavitalea speifideaquila TaxID=3076558 RepID=UPI0028E8A687|nr:hypothetical protein [Paraflavitalea speifideiaquila]